MNNGNRDKNSPEAGGPRAGLYAEGREHDEAVFICLQGKGCEKVFCNTLERVSVSTQRIQQKPSGHNEQLCREEV